MDAPSSAEDALVKIARLQTGDGAWVRRTKVQEEKGDKDGYVWTYAILKIRHEDRLVFIVNERGSSKECSVKAGTKVVRVVAPEYALEEGEKDKQEVLDKFVCMGGSKPYTDPPSICVESLTGEENLFLVPDHDVSMYTLGSEGDALPAVVLQDHESSMYVLVGDGDEGDDASSSNDLDDHNIYVSEHDHDISMYTFHHGMRMAASDENKNRNAAPPSAEVNVPNIDARADCGDDASSSNDLDDRNISISEHDHNMSMHTFFAGVKATSGDKNKNRVATPPQAEVYVPNVEAKADCNEAPPPTDADIPKKSVSVYKHEEKLGARRPSKPPPPPAPISGSSRDGGGDPLDGARKRDVPARRPRGKAREVATGRVGGLVDTKENRKKPSRRATGAQQLSKSLPPMKRVSFSESCKDGTSMGLDSSRKKPTKGTTQPMETTPSNEADFSSSTVSATLSVSSICGPYRPKDHAEHKPARHDNDAKRGKKNRSFRNGKVGATTKDRNVTIKKSCSSNNVIRLIEAYETIGEHQQPSHSDGEETNTLSGDSVRSRNTRGGNITDFRLMCKSIRSESYHRSESYQRQKRKPKPTDVSRRVSWSGELEK